MTTTTSEPSSPISSFQSGKLIFPHPYPFPFPFPYPFPFPGPFDPTFLVRGFACGTGAIHGMLVRRIVEETNQAGGDSVQVMKNLLKNLLSQGWVTERDARQLGQIIQACSTNGRNVPHGELVTRLQKIYKDLLDDNEASAVAIMIGSIAVDSAQSDTTASRGIFSKDVEGALAGAGIGASVGGVGGAVVGGLIGGVLSSVAAHLDAQSAA